MEADSNIEISVDQQIREGIIGCNAVFNTPFGDRKILYADWTASGRALTQVEDYIRNSVLPLYANTHTGDVI